MNAEPDTVLIRPAADAAAASAGVAGREHEREDADDHRRLAI